ncbi:MAG: glycosyltransferase [Planctomycetes bacterium]|nr:glycosyltransferase [Planctomycetota bacterium]
MQTSRKIVLAVNGRIPGPRAHAIATLRLGIALQRLGAAVEIWCPDRRGRSPEAVALEPDAPPIVRLPCTDWIDRAPRWAQRATAALQRASFARAFAREAERRRGEVRWFVLRDPALWSSAVKLELPFAAEVHELPRRRFARQAALAALRQAPHVIALSQLACEALRALGVARADLAVLPSAADERLLGAALQRSTARRALGIALDQRVVSYVGHLHAAKGARRLKDLAAALPEVRVRVVGGLPAERARFARTGLPANLELVGFVAPEQIGRELAAADLVVATAELKSEAARCFGSPVKIAEALAAGCALLAPAVPAARELAGAAADYYRPEDPAEPARAVERLLGDPAALEALRARARAVSREHLASVRAERLLQILGGQVPA